MPYTGFRFGSEEDIRQIASPEEGITINYGGGDQTFDPPLRGVYISSAGDLNIVTPHGTTLLFENLAEGSTLVQQIKTIKQTSSSAGGIGQY